MFVIIFVKSGRIQLNIKKYMSKINEAPEEKARKLSNSRCLRVFKRCLHSTETNKKYIADREAGKLMLEI